MRITVQFFSRLRDLTGDNGAPRPLDLPAGATVGDALARLYADHPGLRGWDRTLLVAVGLEFADRAQPLRDGDELSVMPPVQGG